MTMPDIALEQFPNKSSDVLPEISPEVTIVVVPRERFQFAAESLESLYAYTTCPFDLIYVDNNSPKKLRKHLERQASMKGFQLLQTNQFLSPNQARNLGLSKVKTPYVVFVDNDIIFSEQWLEALIQCSKETGAPVVGSLVCQYRPVHETIHCAGGEFMNAADLAKFVKGEPTVEPTPGTTGQWQIFEKTYHQNRLIEEVKPQLQRQPTGFVEFHSMLVNMDIFAELGPLDEGFSCTKEYLDFCMLLARAGYDVYLEPASVVTFLTHPPAPALRWDDLPYFMVRWSDDWERESLIHFQKKWNLVESKYFVKRLKKLGWRRREEMIQPLVKRFFGKFSSVRQKAIEKQLVAWEKQFNQFWSRQQTSC
jgi:GT2 family glycosyltransferase